MTDWRSTPQAVGESRWSFPPASIWPEDDLIVVGGDLEPATVIGAYRRGLFPMELHGHPGVLPWWSPNLRGIVPLDRAHVSRSTRRTARHYDVRVDTCFVDVVRGCADPRRKDGWITDEFIAAYTRLHHLGWAHSVEVFDREGQLAGGLYGVRVNGLFAGESMFHVRRDASKVAFITAVELMRESGMTLFDVQWRTDHLESLGAVDVPRERYLALLEEAVGTTIP